VTIDDLLAARPNVVNIGLREFAESLRAQGVEVVEVAWTPPPRLDPDVEKLLGELL
jgi:hypothetical protein